MGNSARNNMLWKHLPIFLAVAREGSYSAASETLGIDRTTIARQIAAVETAFSERLFDRVENRLLLTKFGRTLFVAAENAEQQMSVIEEFSSNRRSEAGRIRVSLPDHLLIATSAHFTEFSQTFPDIFIEIIATDRFVDLHQFEADIAFRLASGSPRNLRSIKIGQPDFALYKQKGIDLAALPYLARPGERALPAALKPVATNVKVAMLVDGLLSMNELIASGAGVGILPDYLGRQDTRIERCSGPLPSRELTLTLNHLNELRNVYRIKTFVSFMIKRLKPMYEAAAETQPKQSPR